jgi:oligopeptide transport system substrate-binding protein
MRNHFLKRAAVLVGLGTLAFSGVGLSGCGNNPYPRGETAKNVVYRTFSDLKTLDPTVAYVVSEAEVIDCIYPAFYKYHLLKQSPYALELALGAEEPKVEPIDVTVTEGGKTITKKGEQWTFRIKQGLRFQDDPCFPGGKGREITAADFIYSFKRMADPKLPCPVLSFFQDKILGLDAYVKQNAELSKEGKPVDLTAPVEGLVLDGSDPYTFRIRLNQPYPQLKYMMAMHFTTPIPREAVEKYGEDFARHPVGSGAYLLSEYIPKRRITLETNPNRFEETYPAEGDPGDREAGLLQDAGKRLPLADKVVFTYLKEPIAAWNLFQQGYLDSTAVRQENYSQIMARAGQLTPDMEAKGIKLRKAAAPNIGYYCFNMKDKTWGGYDEKHRKMRQAVSLCIDSQVFIDLLSQGRGKPAQFLIPPGLFGYDPDYKNPYRQVNVEKAKQLLAEAGYKDGIDPKTGKKLVLEFDVPEGGSAGRQVALLVKRQIEQCGIEVKINSWQRVTWEERVHDGKTQFFSYGWLADYPDPENFVFLLYGPNAPGVNYALYDNPEYNKAFEQMRSMPDGPERLKIIQRMRDIVVEDCPWIYDSHSEGLGIYYDWLRNNKPHGVANDTLRYWNVDGEKRARMQAAWNKPVYLPLVILAVVLVVAVLPAAKTVNARRNRSIRRNHGAGQESNGGGNG